MRFYLFESLCDNSRRGQSVEEEKVIAGAEGEEEFYRLSVHVCHRQDTQHLTELGHLRSQLGNTEIHIAPQGTVG